MLNPLRGFVILALTVGLAACDEEEAEVLPDPIRAIKHQVLDTRAGLQTRRIAGIVRAAVSSNVAFEINGQIVELLRKSGDEVEEGDLLARLDPEPYQLQVTQAENSLAQARANADDAAKKYDQQRRLLDQGFTTRTAFDSAEATLKASEASVGVSQSQLDLAKRDLANTDLNAPFSGVIARRDVEVFEEITGGQTIYSIQTSGEGKVEASLPETLLNRVSLGAVVDVTFPPLPGERVEGVVDEIAPLTGDANAYPIEVRLARTPEGLRSGMSAELTFRFATETTGTAFLVPLAAVKPVVVDGSTLADEPDAAVFIYDPESQTLKERRVTVTNVEENALEIVGELQAGEIIATAGISFLYDGMQVTLFDAGLDR